jgi:hypothetical protein
MITLGELLQGGDEDFIINLYLAVLGRWPDEAGLAHHLPLIAGEPQRRMDLVRLIQDSEEARLRGTPIVPDEAPVPPEQALTAQLTLRTRALREVFVEMRAASASLTANSALAGEVAALAAALEGLGVEVRARMAALEAALAGRVPPAPNLSPAVSLDYVNDLVEGAQAELKQRLRALEKRLISPE